MITLSDKEINNIFETFFRKYKYDREEYYDVAAIGFAKAMHKFDKNRKTKFSTFAISCMNLEVLFEMRKQRQKKRYLDSYAESLDRMITEDGFSLDDIVKDESPKEDFVDIETALEKIKKILTAIEYKILEMKMLEMADKDIAIILSLPESTITSIQKNFKYNTKLVEIIYSLEIGEERL